MPSFSKPPSRYEQVQEARDVYLQGTPGRAKSGLLGAARGAFRGLAAGGFGGAVGGAVSGAAGGAINPRGLREEQFNERVLPKIQERFTYEDADRAMQIQNAKAAADQAMNRMQLENIGSQIQSRDAADQLKQAEFERKGRELIPAAPGTTMIDPRTRQPVFTAPDPRQGAMTDAQAEAALTSELGTVEEQSQGSFRGRQEMLKKHLTPDERRIIEGGATSNDDPRVVAAARSKWQKIQDDELNSIRRDTGERRKAAVSQRRFGRKGTPGRTTISQIEADNLLGR